MSEVVSLILNGNKDNYPLWRATTIRELSGDDIPFVLLERAWPKIVETWEPEMIEMAYNHAFMLNMEAPTASLMGSLSYGLCSVRMLRLHGFLLAAESVYQSGALRTDPILQQSLEQMRIWWNRFDENARKPGLKIPKEINYHQLDGFLRFFRLLPASASFINSPPNDTDKWFCWEPHAFFRKPFRILWHQYNDLRELALRNGGAIPEKMILFQYSLAFDITSPQEEAWLTKSILPHRVGRERFFRHYGELNRQIPLSHSLRLAALYEWIANKEDMYAHSSTPRTSNVEICHPHLWLQILIDAYRNKPCPFPYVPHTKFENVGNCPLIIKKWTSERVCALLLLSKAPAHMQDWWRDAAAKVDQLFVHPIQHITQIKGIYDIVLSYLV